MEENHLSHKKLKQKFERNEGSWYETGLVWTENKVPLKKNKSGTPEITFETAQTKPQNI